MSASKQRGTRWESAIVAYLRDSGVLHAERRALGGTQDRGDVAGIPGVVVEAKNCKTTTLAAWVDEAEIERLNDGADVAVVWHHRRGKSNPGDGFVTMSGATLVRLLVAAGYIAKSDVGPVDDPRSDTWAPEHYLPEAVRTQYAEPLLPLHVSGVDRA